MGHAQKDHKLQVGKDLRDPVESEYVHQYGNGKWNRVWTSPDQTPSNSPLSPRTVAPKVQFPFGIGSAK